ncbi:AAA family ATPase [Yinghuangia aomiensis]
MRIDRLDLLAFGCFTDRTLDLAAPGVHVIAGPNEAGKSTARHAIGQLLYGIGERSPYGFVHPLAELRLGALIRDAHGAPLEIVRHKRRKNPLCAPDGTPLDERELVRALADVGADEFAGVFALDHAELRRGGQDLLDGKGDVGRALFESRSSSRLADVQDTLQKDSAALWLKEARSPASTTAPNGSPNSSARSATSPWNRANSPPPKRPSPAPRKNTRAWKATCATSGPGMPPSPGSARHCRSSNSAANSAPSARTSRAPEAPSRTTSSTNSTGSPPGSAKPPTNPHTTAPRSSTPKPTSAPCPPTPRTSTTPTRWKPCPPRSARSARPRNRSASPKRTLGTAARRRGTPRRSPPRTHARRPGRLPHRQGHRRPHRRAAPRPRRPRHRTGRRAGAGNPACRQARRGAGRAGRGSVGGGRRRVASPVACGPRRLRRGSDRAEQQVADRRAKCDALRARHGLSGLDDDAVVRLPLPAREQIDEHRAALDTLRGREDTLAARRAETAERLDKAREDLQKLLRGTAPPTPAELDAAREERDGWWADLEAAAQPADELKASYRQSVLHVDKLADRIREHAADSLRRVDLEIAIERDTERLATHDADLADVVRTRDGLAAHWAALWEPSGVVAPEPAAAPQLADGVRDLAVLIDEAARPGTPSTRSARNPRSSPGSAPNWRTPGSPPKPLPCASCPVSPTCGSTPPPKRSASAAAPKPPNAPRSTNATRPATTSAAPKPPGPRGKPPGPTWSAVSDSTATTPTRSPPLWRPSPRSPATSTPWPRRPGAATTRPPGSPTSTGGLRRC